MNKLKASQFISNLAEKSIPAEARNRFIEVTEIRSCMIEYRSSLTKNT